MDRALTGRVVRYAVAGIVATAIYFVGVMILVEWLHVRPVPAAVAATVVVIVTSYVINRVFVFETSRAHASAFTRFVLASLLGIALNAGLMHLATAILGWPYPVGAALTVVVVPPLNFAVNYFWAFRSAR